MPKSSTNVDKLLNQLRIAYAIHQITVPGNYFAIDSICSGQRNPAIQGEMLLKGELALVQLQ